MNEQDTHSRKTIPKLRVKGSVPLSETASLGTLNISPVADEAMEKKALSVLDDWSDRPSIENALSAIDVAASCLDKKPFFGAAKQVLDHPHTRLLAKRLAQFVLGSPMEQTAQVLTLNTDASEQISTIRKRLSDGPRNAHLWLELGRLHTFAGNNRAAYKAFRIAVQLAPNDRFVLRSFCRFSVHAWSTKELEEMP